MESSLIHGIFWSVLLNQTYADFLVLILLLIFCQIALWSENIYFTWIQSTNYNLLIVPLWSSIWSLFEWESFEIMCILHFLGVAFYICQFVLCAFKIYILTTFLSACADSKKYVKIYNYDFLRVSLFIQFIYSLKEQVFWILHILENADYAFYWGCCY